MSDTLSETKKKDEKNKDRLAKISREYWSDDKHREEQSERLRVATIKRIENMNGQIIPNYNKNSQ